MKKKSLTKEALENSFWDFISKIIEKIGSLVFTIILARFLLPEGFGIYSLSLSVALIFVSFINFAPESSLIRYVSSALGKKDKKLARSYFKYLLKIKLILAFVVSILLLLLAYPISYYLFKKPFLFAPLFILGFYIFILSIHDFYDTLFYAFEKVKKKAIKNILHQTLRIFISLLVFFLVARSYYVIGVIFGLILTNLIIVLFILIYARQFVGSLFKGEEKKIDKKRILRFVGYLSITGISTMIFSYIDILMLGIFLEDVSYTGFYNSSIVLVWGVAGLLRFRQVFLPIFTKVKRKSLEEVFNRVMKYSFIITIPATFGIVVLSRYIIFAVYGSEYVQASFLLPIMAFLVIESVNGAFVASLFSAKEKPSSVTKILIVAVILNVILNIILINLLLNISQLWASIGAAIATLISKYVLFFSLIMIAKKELKVKLRHINWVKPLIASLVMFVFLFLINKFMIKDMSLVTGLIEIVLGMIIYFVFMLLIKGVTKKDIQLFKSQLVQ